MCMVHAELYFGDFSDKIIRKMEDEVLFTKLEDIKPEIEEKQCSQDNGSNAQLKCPNCIKVMSNEKNLNLHIKRVHLQLKDFFCDQCTSCFSTNQELKSHSLSHSENRYFKCSFCEKSFKTKNYLKIHIRIHTGEKPYFCDQCGKSFSNQSQMISHKKERHSGDIPFPCNLCEKGFKTQKYFRLHMKSHLQLDNKKDTTVPGGHEKGFETHLRKQNKNETERRKHSENFKLECIKKAEEFGLRQTASQLGLEPVLIRGWLNIKNQKYVCETCGDLFPFQSKLTRHI